ncbi:hypothetical protein EVG20_g11113, partial [Dentipellis fragilis]
RGYGLVLREKLVHNWCECGCSTDHLGEVCERAVREDEQENGVRSGKQREWDGRGSGVYGWGTEEEEDIWEAELDFVGSEQPEDGGGDALADMSIGERMEWRYLRAEKEKEQGNVAFKKGDFERAITHYVAASKIEPEMPHYHLNLAAAHLKLSQWVEAETACDRALSQHRSGKGYFRRARARKMRGQTDGAIKDLRAALLIQPSNAEARTELAALLPDRSRPPEVAGSSSSSSSHAYDRAREDDDEALGLPRAKPPKPLPFAKTEQDTRRLKIAPLPITLDLPEDMGLGEDGGRKGKAGTQMQTMSFSYPSWERFDLSPPGPQERSFMSALDVSGPGSGRAEKRQFTVNEMHMGPSQEAEEEKRGLLDLGRERGEPGKGGRAWSWHRGAPIIVCAAGMQDRSASQGIERKQAEAGTRDPSAACSWSTAGQPPRTRSLCISAPVHHPLDKRKSDVPPRAPAPSCTPPTSHMSPQPTLSAPPNHDSPMNGFHQVKIPSIPKKTALAIDFVVIGGGVAGLACAVALRRVGHRVTVVEKETRIDGVRPRAPLPVPMFTDTPPSPPPQSSQHHMGGTRMPPNMTKIFYHWGLGDKILAPGVISERVIMSRLESGRVLGSHRWDSEMLEEAGGEFIFLHHAKLRQIFYETAVERGATIRLGANAVSVSEDGRSVTLSTGEVVHADVVIGADGAHGLCRELVDEDDDAGRPSGLMMFGGIVPGAAMRADPRPRAPAGSGARASVHYYGVRYTAYAVTQWVWFGDKHCALCFPIVSAPAADRAGRGRADGDGARQAKGEDCALYLYSPDTGSSDDWGELVSAGDLASHATGSEQRLQKLARLAHHTTRHQLREWPDLDDWVHESGRLVVVGEAAHPFPPGSIQGASMSLEDASVLGKLFSHLISHDQIESFLVAFQELRQERAKKNRIMDMAN